MRELGPGGRSRTDVTSGRSLQAGALPPGAEAAAPDIETYQDAGRPAGNVEVARLRQRGFLL